MVTEEDWYTVEAMQKFGGSFVQALAKCLHRADHINYKKLKDAFPEYINKYRVMGDKMKTRGGD